MIDKEKLGMRLVAPPPPLLPLWRCVLFVFVNASINVAAAVASRQCHYIISISKIVHVKLQTLYKIYFVGVYFHVFDIDDDERTEY